MSPADASLLEKLKTVKATDIPVFTLKGYVTPAKLVSIYDGDTGDIVFPYQGSLMHVKARFMGYDTCEMKPLLSDPERESKKKRAILAKNRLWQLCTGCESCEKTDHNTLITVVCSDFDKYGRTLVTAYPYGTDVETCTKSINQQMIDEGHAYVYDGGKKSTTF